MIKYIATWFAVSGEVLIEREFKAANLLAAMRMAMQQTYVEAASIHIDLYTEEAA